MLLTNSRILNPHARHASAPCRETVTSLANNNTCDGRCPCLQGGRGGPSAARIMSESGSDSGRLAVSTTSPVTGHRFLTFSANCGHDAITKCLCQVVRPHAGGHELLLRSRSPLHHLSRDL